MQSSEFGLHNPYGGNAAPPHDARAVRSDLVRRVLALGVLTAGFSAVAAGVASAQPSEHDDEPAGASAPESSPSNDPSSEFSSSSDLAVPVEQSREAQPQQWRPDTYPVEIFDDLSQRATPDTAPGALQAPAVQQPRQAQNPPVSPDPGTRTTLSQWLEDPDFDGTTSGWMTIDELSQTATSSLGSEPGAPAQVEPTPTPSAAESGGTDSTDVTQSFNPDADWQWVGATPLDPLPGTTPAAGTGSSQSADRAATATPGSSDASAINPGPSGVSAEFDGAYQVGGYTFLPSLDCALSPAGQLCRAFVGPEELVSAPADSATHSWSDWVEDGGRYYALGEDQFGRSEGVRPDGAVVFAAADPSLSWSWERKANLARAGYVEDENGTWTKDGVAVLTHPDGRPAAVVQPIPRFTGISFSSVTGADWWFGLSNNDVDLDYYRRPDGRIEPSLAVKNSDGSIADRIDTEWMVYDWLDSYRQRGESGQEASSGAPTADATPSNDPSSEFSSSSDLAVPVEQSREAQPQQWRPDTYPVEIFDDLSQRATPDTAPGALQAPAVQQPRQAQNPPVSPDPGTRTTLSQWLEDPDFDGTTSGWMTIDELSQRVTSTAGDGPSQSGAQSGVATPESSDTRWDFQGGYTIGDHTVIPQLGCAVDPKGQLCRAHVSPTQLLYVPEDRSGGFGSFRYPENWVKDGGFYHNLDGDTLFPWTDRRPDGAFTIADANPYIPYRRERALEGSGYTKQEDGVWTHGKNRTVVLTDPRNRLSAVVKGGVPEVAGLRFTSGVSVGDDVVDLTTSDGATVTMWPGRYNRLVPGAVTIPTPDGLQRLTDPQEIEAWIRDRQQSGDPHRTSRQLRDVGDVPGQSTSDAGTASPEEDATPAGEREASGGIVLPKPDPTLDPNAANDIPQTEIPDQLDRPTSTEPPYELQHPDGFGAGAQPAVADHTGDRDDVGDLTMPHTPAFPPAEQGEWVGTPKNGPLAPKAPAPPSATATTPESARTSPFRPSTPPRTTRTASTSPPSQSPAPRTPNPVQQAMQLTGKTADQGVDTVRATVAASVVPHAVRAAEKAADDAMSSVGEAITHAANNPGEVVQAAGDALAGAAQLVLPAVGRAATEAAEFMTRQSAF